MSERVDFERVDYKKVGVWKLMFLEHLKPFRLATVNTSRQWAVVHWPFGAIGANIEKIIFLSKIYYRVDRAANQRFWKVPTFKVPTKGTVQMLKCVCKRSSPRWTSVNLHRLNKLVSLTGEGSVHRVYMCWVSNSPRSNCPRGLLQLRHFRKSFNFSLILSYDRLQYCRLMLQMN